MSFCLFEQQRILSKNLTSAKSQIIVLVFAAFIAKLVYIGMKGEGYFRALRVDQQVDRRKKTKEPS